MNLKKTIAFWEQVMTSITFAEANEHDEALQIMEKKKSLGVPEHDVSMADNLTTSPGKYKRHH